jgi:hypothetical protein
VDEKHDEAPVTVPSREETVYTSGTTRASTTPPDWRTSGRRAMARKKVSTTIYIEPEQLELLKLLNERTKVPMAEYIREGIDLVLKRHQDKLPGQLPLEPPATSKG